MLSPNVDVKNEGDYLKFKFLDVAAERNYLLSKNITYNCESLDDSLEAAASRYLRSGSTQKFALIEDADAVGMIGFAYGTASINAYAIDQETLDSFVKKLKAYAPEEPPAVDDDIFVTFWAYGSHGPTQQRRRLTSIPKWDTIDLNYNGETRSVLSPLMEESFRPGAGGQLILWHGAPGTGKTTALRAMARQWRDWCEIHYVVDPEKFFGSHADYMMQVMTEPSRKWKLLVLEDTGEFLVPDARVQMGNSQGLSRFLNAMDGLLGQGIEFFCLVTTNEEIKKLHPAVTRPGRCLSIAEFKALTADEVRNWAEYNEVPRDDLSPSLTIAELYSAKNHVAPSMQKKSKPVGFAVTA